MKYSVVYMVTGDKQIQWCDITGNIILLYGCQCLLATAPVKHAKPTEALWYKYTSVKRIIIDLGNR